MAFLANMFRGGLRDVFAIATYAQMESQPSVCQNQRHLVALGFCRLLMVVLLFPIFCFLAKLYCVF